MPARKDLPGTLRHSPTKAQRTWAKTHDSAVEEYGEGERAHRTAYATLKRTFQKVGDHWEAKERPGPSDPRAKTHGAEARDGRAETFGGVDVEGNTKQDLYEIAVRLGVRGRSRMTKRELARAIQKAG